MYPKSKPVGFQKFLAHFYQIWQSFSDQCLKIRFKPTHSTWHVYARCFVIEASESSSWVSSYSIFYSIIFFTQSSIPGTRCCLLIESATTSRAGRPTRWCVSSRLRFLWLEQYCYCSVRLDMLSPVRSARSGLNTTGQLRWVEWDRALWTGPSFHATVFQQTVEDVPLNLILNVIVLTV